MAWGEDELRRKFRHGFSGDFSKFDMEATYLLNGSKVKPTRKVSYPTLEVEYLEGDKKGEKAQVSVGELTKIEP